MNNTVYETKSETEAQYFRYCKAAVSAEVRTIMYQSENGIQKPGGRVCFFMCETTSAEEKDTIRSDYNNKDGVNVVLRDFHEAFIVIRDLRIAAYEKANQARSKKEVVNTNG